MAFEGLKTNVGFSPSKIRLFGGIVMVPSLEELKATVSNLSLSDRAELAHHLLQSLENGDADASLEWLALAERRMADVQAGRVTGIPVAQTLESLRSRYNMSTHDVPIGAKVSFRIAGRSLVGRVLQDRGPIGKGGRHLYLVRYEVGKGNWNSTELPFDEMESIENKPVNLRKAREVE